MTNGFEARSAEVEALADEIAAIAARRDAVTHALLARLRAFDEADGWARQGAMTFAHWLNWRIGLSLGVAREHVRVARALGRLRRVDAALACGELSFSKVRALTRVATPDNEETLLVFARDATASQIERICRAYARVADPDEPAVDLSRWVRRRWTDVGMVRIEVQVTPDEADLVMKALVAAGTTPSAEVSSTACDVAAETRRAIGRGIGNEASDQALPDVNPETIDNPRPRYVPEAVGLQVPDPYPAVVADRDFAAATPPEVRDAAAETPRESRDVAAETPRAWPDDWDGDRRADALLMMCESFLARGPAARSGAERWQVMVHLGPRALPVPTGPATEWAALLDDGSRIAPEALRRIACDSGLVALQYGEDGTPLDVGRRTRAISPALRRALLARDGGCRFPGCTNRLWVDAHHVRHWLDGGETSLGNVVLVCRTHHRLVHEGGFGVGVGAHGIEFHDAEGRSLPRAPRAASPAGASNAEGQRAFAPVPYPSCARGELDLAEAVLALMPAAPSTTASLCDPIGSSDPHADDVRHPHHGGLPERGLRAVHGPSA